MKERGVLFSAPLVKALLAGTKTQTRRLLKPKTEPWRNHYMEGGCQKRDWGPSLGDDSDPAMWWWTSAFAAQEPIGRCPYGVPGDRLWVRETWMELYDAGDGVLTCLPPTGEDSRKALRRAKYRADGEKPEGFAASWRPSLLMPRWASRITLEVTEVRVQRLQDISEEDAKAEGVEPVPFCRAGTPPGNEHREAFQQLWDAINGERASWASNPWVWCVSFKRVETKP